MNEDTLKSAETTDLDALFSQARDEKPLLFDTNFTKVIVNRLPSKVSRVERRGLSFDVLGMVLGLVAVSFFIEPTQLFSSMLNVIPETLTLTPVTLAMGLLSVLGLSLSAWWAVEKIA